MTLRVDQVGSLLRPEGLKEVFARHGEGQANDAELLEAQNAAVRDVVAKQEAHNLAVLTDGEFRRLGFKDSLGDSVAGFGENREGSQSFQQQEGQKPLQRWDYGPPGQKQVLRGFGRPLTQRMTLGKNLPLEEFQFAKGLSAKPFKVTLIGPGRVLENFRGVDPNHLYADIDDLAADVVAVERQIVGGLVEAGCTYVQIDAPNYTAFADQPSLDTMKERGEDPQQNLERTIRADNAIVAEFPGVTFGVHLCRGNERSMWHREGTYDAIAERLFGELHHGRLLLEYDSERAGTFAALRFVPKGKVVVLGLVTSKLPELESADDIKRRIDDASKHLPLDQLALSPQCGFASGIAGNLLSEDDQWRKFDLINEVAADIWR
ncbi:MAG: 5-methyltetrahydropteroyltriglutamate--homocysteine methyltransferase [Chloroflexi bacterium]|jgi:5-methyltetrahydropteroyltriglutamate--homocysteine methyltransferase|nr:MAG: 5-methyltetrahydropteroyltriglutamate--homocysteine methyltransferase [Chloroflexota bacterium]